MKNKRIAIIGCGNIGSALIRGLCARVFDNPKKIIGCDPDSKKLQELTKHLGIDTASKLDEAVRDADIIILAVKPLSVVPVMTELEPLLSARAEKPIVLSVAAGITIAEIRSPLESPLKSSLQIGRVMPNLPCIVGQGLSAIFSESAEIAKTAAAIFASVGETVVVERESLLDIATGLASSGPAFIFVAIEALADGGVKMGLSREQATRMAAQMVHGSAALVLQSGEHPAALKDKVASPAGTTMAGLHELEKGGFRGILISAVEASTMRARQIMAKRSD